MGPGFCNPLGVGAKDRFCQKFPKTHQIKDNWNPRFAKHTADPSGNIKEHYIASQFGRRWQGEDVESFSKHQKFQPPSEQKIFLQT